MARTSSIVVSLALTAKLAAAGQSGEEILRLTLAGETRQAKLREQYTWHDHQENGPARADGSQIKVNIKRDFDVVFLEGGFYRKLVAINGKPLSSKQAREEESKMQMTAAQRRSQHAPKGTRRSGVPLGAILNVMDHRFLREEDSGGHKCWVVQSEPRKDAVPGTPAETEALSYRYVQWIDQEEKVIIRKQWEVIGKGVETEVGSRNTVDFAKNADSVWLPQRAEHFIVTGDRFGSSHVLQTDTYSGYRKFTSETNIDFDESR